MHVWPWEISRPNQRCCSLSTKLGNGSGIQSPTYISMIQTLPLFLPTWVLLFRYKVMAPHAGFVQLHSNLSSEIEGKNFGLSKYAPTTTESFWTILAKKKRASFTDTLLIPPTIRCDFNFYLQTNWQEHIGIKIVTHTQCTKETTCKWGCDIHCSCSWYMLSWAQLFYGCTTVIGQAT